MYCTFRSTGHRLADGEKTLLTLYATHCAVLYKHSPGGIITQRMKKGDIVKLSERAERRGKYKHLTRWGIEIRAEVVSCTEKGDCVMVRVEGEERVTKWHKTYWVSLESRTFYDRVEESSPGPEEGFCLSSFFPP